jgi:hypothetical protein
MLGTFSRRSLKGPTFDRLPRLLKELSPLVGEGSNFGLWYYQKDLKPQLFILMLLRNVLWGVLLYFTP